MAKSCNNQDDLLKYLEGVQILQISVSERRQKISDLQNQVKDCQEKINTAVEVIRQYILDGQGFGDLRDWLFTIGSPAEEEQFVALTAYWRQLEQNFKDHQGELVIITEERLTGGEITKHYLSEFDFNMHPLVPPPQPYFYLHGFFLGIIEGEMSFNFAKHQCFLPMNGYCRVSQGQPDEFLDGRLPLPKELFGGPELIDGSLLREFFPWFFGPKCRARLAVGEEEIGKLTVEHGMRLDRYLGEEFKKDEAILRAKKKARESQTE